MFEVFRIARQQLDGLGHRVVSGPVGGLSGEPAASPGRRSVALSQHEIGNAVLGIQVTGLTRSGGSALDVVGNETHQRNAHEQLLTLGGVLLNGQRLVQIGLGLRIVPLFWKACARNIAVSDEGFT